MNESPLQQEYYLKKEHKLSVKGFFIGIAKWIYNSIQTFVIFFAILMMLYLFVISPHVTDGISMQPNFCNGDVYLVEKITPFLRTYEHDQVLAFKHDDANDYIKRIVGLPGDKVKVQEGKVYRNGELLNEVYLPPGRETNIIVGDRLIEGDDYLVPQHQLFVMGDNRPNSMDSRRFLAIDPENVNTVKGRVVMVVWPLERARVFDQVHANPENLCDKQIAQ